MPSRTYSARVMRFRQGVYLNRGRISAGCQVLLLRLSEDMNANAIVSKPRSQLAAEFGCPPVRITEWIKQAKEQGFLSTVKRGQPGVTAVYQGMYVASEVRPAVPSEVRPAVPSTRYAETNQAEVREGVPLNGATWYAQHPCQEVVATGTDSAFPDRPGRTTQQ